jgi:hypothetical protein
MLLLIDGRFFVSQQNYNHSISGMAALFAAHARTFFTLSPFACLLFRLPDRL